MTTAPMQNLSGKVALVTGGGRGLGRAMALGLAEAGASVVISAAVETSEIEAVAAEGRTGDILPVRADVTHPEDCAGLVEAALARFGRLDILVNNAGRGMKYVSEDFLTAPTHFWETKPDVWRRIVDTNVNGPFYMARAVVPALLRAGWGRIVNISMNHETMRRAGFSPYGPSKAALESETAIWAQDLAGTGVTVNALLPGGATATGMIPASFPVESRTSLLDSTIMVAPLLWLASNASDGITGQRIDAKLWRTDVPAEQAARMASTPSGWAMPPGG